MSQKNSLIPVNSEGCHPAVMADGYNFDLFRHGRQAGPNSGAGPNVYRWPEPARLLLRRKGVLLLCSALGGLCALLVTLRQTPLYEARTSLEIQSLDDNPLRVRDNGSGSSATESNPEYDLQTKIRILQSQSLIESVLSKLNMENRLAVQAKRTPLWRRYFGGGEPDTLTPEQAMAAAVAEAGRNLKIRGQANSRIVEIYYKSADRDLAPAFANTLANEFIQHDLESRWQTAQHTESFFRNQLAEVKTQLEASEQQLQSYGNNVGLLFSSQKEDVSEDRLRQLQQELLRSQADRVAKQSSYLITSGASPDSLPAVLDDPTLKEYQIKLTDLRRELAALDTTLTPANAKVKKVQSQISALEAALETSRANIVRRLQNEYLAAQRREQMLQSEYVAQSRVVGSQAVKIARYNIIKRDVDTNRQLYDSMLQRVKETGIVAALRSSSIRVIDSAKPSPFAAGRNFGSNVLLGLFGGGLLGCACIALRYRFNRTIQEPGDALCYLNAVELGTIPTGISAWRLPFLPGSSDEKTERRELAMTMQHQAVSPMAESFRAILTSLLYAKNDGAPLKVIVVSSANPAEGKTTVTCNLAIALARVNKRVLLVDGDLRAPRLHEIFEVDNRAGLSDALLDAGQAGVSPLELRATSVPNLSLLTRGAASGEDLVYSARLPEIIERLRGQFDAVLIDSPPVLYAPDARVFGQHADAVIMVIRARHTTRDAAELAFNRFSQDGIQVLGTILNDWNVRRTTAYGYEVYRSKRYYHYANPEPAKANPQPKDAAPIPKDLISIFKS